MPCGLVYWLPIITLLVVISFSFNDNDLEKEFWNNSLHWSANKIEKIDDKKTDFWDFIIRDWYLLWNIVWEVIDEKWLDLPYQEKEFFIKKVSKRYTYNNIEEFRNNSTADENVELFSWWFLNKTLPKGFVIKRIELEQIVEDLNK